MTAIPAVALIDCLNQFKQDWSSIVCPVCLADKWKNSPFRRLCSIKIQRVGLMRGYKDWTGHTIKAMFRFFLREDPDGDCVVVYDWVTWYDRCRDYLRSNEARSHHHP